MIKNSTIQNCNISFPAIQGLVNNQVLGKILIKNIYQNWKGESIKEIKEQHKDNPYSLRIGTPTTDNHIKNDKVYFITHYMAYNPITKSIEKRDLIDYRNTEKVYIGQTVEESIYDDYLLFVNGNAVFNDVYLKDHESLKNNTIGQVLTTLVSKIEKLQAEVIELKRQIKNTDNYMQSAL